MNKLALATAICALVLSILSLQKSRKAFEFDIRLADSIYRVQENVLSLMTNQYHMMGGKP